MNALISLYMLVGIACMLWVALTSIIGAIRLSLKPLFVYSVSFLSYSLAIGTILASSYTNHEYKLLNSLTGIFFVCGVACNFIFELALNGRDQLDSKNVSLSDVILLRRLK